METSVIVPSHPIYNEEDKIPSGVASNEEDPFGTDIIDKNSYEDAVNTDDEFVDDYSHTEPNVFYTTHNIPGPGIDVELFYSQISRRCNCSINETKSDEKDLKPEIIKNGIRQVIETKSSHGNYVSMNREIEQVDGIIDDQNRLCAENCQCNLGPNYNNRKLNIDIYKLPIYECNNFCGCQKIKKSGIRGPQRCSNRVIQNGPNKNLVIFHHAKIARKGYGVKASKAINQGEFICEYVGEVIDKVEAKRRYAIYKEQNFQRHQQILKQDEETEFNEKPQKEPEMKINSCNFYIFNLNEIVDHSEASISSNPKNLSLYTQNSTKKSNKKDSVSSISEITSNSTSLSTSLVSEEGSSSNDDLKPNLLNTYNQTRSNEFSSTFEMFIDATAFGNIARYINHSCDPNCVVLPVRINSIYPSLAIFAKRDIERGEELGYDYAGLDDAEQSLDESILGERESVLEKNSRNFERPNTKFRYIDERKVTNVNERRNTEMDEASEEVKAEINVSGRKSVSDTEVDNINKNSTTQIKGLSNTEIDKSLSSEDVKDEINIRERKLRGSNEKYYPEVTYVSGSSTSQVEELDTNRTSKDILLKLVSDINDEVKNPNEKDLTPCHCGSKKCRKFLPFSLLQ